MQARMTEDRNFPPGSASLAFIKTNKGCGDVEAECLTLHIAPFSSKPNTVEQGTSLDNTPDLGCSQACFTQWSEGDTFRVAIHLLGHTGETDCEEDTSWLCCLSKV